MSCQNDAASFGNLCFATFGNFIQDVAIKGYVNFCLFWKVACDSLEAAGCVSNIEQVI